MIVAVIVTNCEHFFPQKSHCEITQKSLFHDLHCWFVVDLKLRVAGLWCWSDGGFITLVIFYNNSIKVLNQFSSAVTVKASFLLFLLHPDWSHCPVFQL